MYLLNQSLSTFKRKAYERYLTNKAASGDKTSKEILNAKKWFTKERGIVDQSARNVLAKRTNAIDTNKESILRNGFIKGNDKIKRLDKNNVNLTGKYKGQAAPNIEQRIANKTLETKKQNLLNSISEGIKNNANKVEHKTNIEPPKFDFTEISKLNKKARTLSNIRKGLALGAGALTVSGLGLLAANKLRKARSDKNKKHNKRS